MIYTCICITLSSVVEGEGLDQFSSGASSEAPTHMLILYQTAHEQTLDQSFGRLKSAVATKQPTNRSQGRSTQCLVTAEELECLGTTFPVLTHTLLQPCPRPLPTSAHNKAIAKKITTVVVVQHLSKENIKYANNDFESRLRQLILYPYHYWLLHPESYVSLFYPGFSLHVITCLSERLLTLASSLFLGSVELV